MFEGKLQVEKVELVKRIIRQNNYDQYEKNHAMCTELGLHVNRSALDRFADKLALIDRAELLKRQQQLQRIDEEKRQLKAQASTQQSASGGYQQPPAPTPSVSKPDAVVPADAPVRSLRPSLKSRAPKPAPPMSYEAVKKREQEITFELGELKIRETELLQELIDLSTMLDDKGIN